MDREIIVVRVSDVDERGFYSYNDYSLIDIIRVTENWQVISEVDYYELRNAIELANANLRKDKLPVRYQVIERVNPRYYDVIHKNAQEFVAYQKEQERLKNDRRDKAKKKREEASIARKRKQLEKLKKELEGENKAKSNLT